MRRVWEVWCLVFLGGFPRGVVLGIFFLLGGGGVSAYDSSGGEKSFYSVVADKKFRPDESSLSPGAICRRFSFLVQNVICHLARAILLVRQTSSIFAGMKNLLLVFFLYVEIKNLLRVFCQWSGLFLTYFLYFVSFHDPVKNLMVNLDQGCSLVFIQQFWLPLSGVQGSLGSNRKFSARQRNPTWVKYDFV